MYDLVSDRRWMLSGTQMQNTKVRQNGEPKASFITKKPEIIHKVKSKNKKRKKCTNTQIKTSK